MLSSGIELLTPETVEPFSIPKAIIPLIPLIPLLPLISVLYQYSYNKDLQTFLAHSVVPDLFK